MLSNVYSEGEFFRFGSGYLLRDLINYINFDNNDHSKKIIFIGDNAQLPPVNMNFSPALDSKYLKEICNIESQEFELKEVVRNCQYITCSIIELFSYLCRKRQWILMTLLRLG